MKTMLALWEALACAASPVRAAAVTVKSGDAGAGKAVFLARCAICHGQTGKGVPTQAKALKADPTKMDLTGPDVRKAATEDLAKIVSEGRNKMPPFKDKLTTAQIADVVAYLRSLGASK